MAAKFVLTAQLQLQAPTNTRTIVNQVRKQLSGVQMKIDANVNTQSLAKANKQVQAISGSARQASGSLKGMAASSNSLGAALGAAARRFASITLATGFFLGITRAIGGALGKAIQFEKELLKISQVTGKTVKQLGGLVEEVTALSTSLGASSEELLNASRTLAQAGFSAEKVTGALKILAQTDLAATFNNIKDTTEGAIALLSQFRKEVVAAGGEVKFLEASLDAINSVSKSFAVESSDLIAVIRRTGGVFEAAGGKLNELIALFTSVRATTRETAETIATGFRTIFTRIQRTETIDSLKELGITLQDTEGKFVGPLEAIKRLSVGLRALDPRDFRFNEIVEQLGGFRQIGKVIPLLKQYETSAQALAVANNSAGSTAADAATAQLGLGVQFDKLKEKFAETMRTIADSGTFKALATSAIKLAEAILSIVDALEPLLPMLTALMAFKLGSLALPALGRFTGMMPGRSSGGVVRGFAGGGLVPGRGHRDTVPAMLQPGEFVMRKSAVSKIGSQNMASMNQGEGYMAGGRVSSRRGYYNKAPTTSSLNAPAPTGSHTGVQLRRSDPNAAGGSIPIEQIMTMLKGSKVEYGLMGPMYPGGVSLDYKEGGKNFKENTSARGWGQLPLTQLSRKGIGMLLTRLQGKPKMQGATFKDMEMAKARGASYGATLGPSQFPIAGVKDPLLRAGLDDSMVKVSQRVLKRGVMLVVSALRKDPDVASAINAMKLSMNPQDAQKAATATSLDEQAVNTMKGFFFEGAIHALSGAAPMGGGAAFDLPEASVTGSRGSLANMFGPMVNQMKMAEVKTSRKKLGEIPKKLKNWAIDKGQVIDYARTGLFERSVKMAKGGEVGSDSVPAMLTPGEFVLNKKSATNVGYGKLHRMNQSGGVKGFAAGGIVGSTRSNYGVGVGGGGGGGAGGAGMQAVNTSAQGLATELLRLSSVVESAYLVIGGTRDAFVLITEQAGKFATALGTTVNAFSPIKGGVELLVGALGETAEVFIRAPLVAFSPLYAAMENFATGAAQVDDIMREAAVAAFQPLLAAITDAAKGIATIDDIMKGVANSMSAPIQASVKALEAEMKIFGEALLLKAAYFDTLKVAVEALEAKMVALGTALAEKADDWAPIQRQIAPLVDAMAEAALQTNNFASWWMQIRTPMNNLYKGLTTAAGKITEQSDDLDVMKNPANAMMRGLGRGAGLAHKFANYMVNLNEAVLKFTTGLNAGTVSVGVGSAEMLELTARIEALEQKLMKLSAENSKLIIAFIRATEGANMAGTRLATTGGTGGKGGGGMMAGGGGQVANQMMMMAMMAGMMVTQFGNFSAAMEKTIMAVTMLGMIGGMVALELGPMIGGFVASFFASSASAAADLAETPESLKAAAADAAEAAASSMAAGAAMVMTGALMGIAVGITAWIATNIYLRESAKELAEEFTKSMKELRAGTGSADIVQQRAAVAKALKMEAQATKGSGFAKVATGIAIALAVVALAVVTWGASLPATAALLAAAALKATVLTVAIGLVSAGIIYGGYQMGRAFATVSEAMEGIGSLWITASFRASTAVNNLANANKKMELELLTGVELMRRQGKAFHELSKTTKLAMTAFSLGQSQERGANVKFEDELDSSDVFEQIKDSGVEAMQELGKVWFSTVTDMRTGINGAMEEMRDAGASIAEVFDSRDIKQQLSDYETAVATAVAIQQMVTGVARMEAKERLDLTDVANNLLTAEQEALILIEEENIIREKSTEAGEKARVAQKKQMKEQMVADAKAKKMAADKLAADIVLAQSTHKAAMALNYFEVALLVVARAGQRVDMELGGLSGTIKRFKSDAGSFIKTLKEGTLTSGATGAARQVGAHFGIGDEVDKLIARIGDSSRIRDVLINKGLEDLAGGLDEAAATTQWKKFLEDNRIDLSFLGKEINQQILNMLENGLQEDEVAEIMDMVNGANEGQIEVLEKLAKAQDAYLNSLFKFGSAIDKLRGSYAKAIGKLVDVQLKGAERLAKARGREPGVAGVRGAEERRRNAALTSRGLVGGDTATTSAQLNRRRSRQAELRERIDRSIAAGANPEQVINMQNEQKKLSSETKALTENLKKLSDQSKVAAAIMKGIDKERGKREAVQGLIKEFTFATNEARQDMDRNFMALRRVLQTGTLSSIPDEMRGAVGGLLDTLKDISIGPGGQTGGEISKMLQIQTANQLAIRARGRPLTREEMQKIWNQTTKEEQLIDDLRMLSMEEQQAAIALAQFEADNMRDLIHAIADLVTVLKNAQIIAGGNAGAALGVATGGSIFAPRGTDTVPAMLTPGEFVVNRGAAQRNAGALRAINNGGTQYLQGGGGVAGFFGPKAGGAADIGGKLLSAKENKVAREFIDYISKQTGSESALGSTKYNYGKYWDQDKRGLGPYQTTWHGKIETGSPMFRQTAMGGVPVGKEGQQRGTERWRPTGDIAGVIPFANEAIAKGNNPLGGRPDAGHIYTHAFGYKTLVNKDYKTLNNKEETAFTGLDSWMKRRVPLPGGTQYQTMVNPKWLDKVRDLEKKSTREAITGSSRWSSDAFFDKVRFGIQHGPSVTDSYAGEQRQVAGPVEWFDGYKWSPEKSGEWYDSKGQKTIAMERRNSDDDNWIPVGSMPEEKVGKDKTLEDRTTRKALTDLQKFYVDQMRGMSSSYGRNTEHFLGNRKQYIQDYISGASSGPDKDPGVLYDEFYGRIFQHLTATPEGALFNYPAWKFGDNWSGPVGAGPLENLDRVSNKFKQAYGLGLGSDTSGAFQNLPIDPTSPGTWDAEGQINTTVLDKISAQRKAARDVLAGWNKDLKQKPADPADMPGAGDFMAAGAGPMFAAQKLDEFQRLVGTNVGGVGVGWIKGEQAKADKEEEDVAAAEKKGDDDAAMRLANFQRNQRKMLDVFFIFREKKAEALTNVLGEYPSGAKGSPLYGPRVPKYSGLRGTKGFGIVENLEEGTVPGPGSVKMVTQMPRTADSFNAMFPYLAHLGFDLWRAGGLGAIAGVGEGGVQYDPRLMSTMDDKRLKAMLGIVGPFAEQDPHKWFQGDGGYDGITPEEAWYTGLFLGGGPEAGMAKAQKMVDHVQSASQRAIADMLLAPQPEAGRKQEIFRLVQAFFGGVPGWLAAAGREALAAGAVPPAGGAPPAVNRASGGPIGGTFKPHGTDTVPAMLTPGEFVMKKSAVDKYGMNFMSAINEGNAGSRSGYMAEGGNVASQFATGEDTRIGAILSAVKGGAKSNKKNFSGVFAGQNQEARRGGEGAVNLQQVSEFLVMMNENIMDGRRANVLNWMEHGERDMRISFASGGIVPGAGGGDTVPAMLTPGEFVMKKSAVNKYGMNFMGGLNGGVQRFATGGPVLDGPWLSGALPGSGEEFLDSRRIIQQMNKLKGTDYGNQALFPAFAADWYSGIGRAGMGGKGVWRDSDLGPYDALLKQKIWVQALADEVQNENLFVDRHIAGMYRGYSLSRESNITGVNLGRTEGSMPRWVVSGPFQFVDRGNVGGFGKDLANTPLKNITSDKFAPLWQQFAVLFGGGDRDLMLPGASGFGALTGRGITFNQEWQQSAEDQLMFLIGNKRWDPFAAPGAWLGKRIQAGWIGGIPEKASDLWRRAWHGDPAGNVPALPPELIEAQARKNMGINVIGKHYFAGGGMARGTDTVPAMLTPGEYVMRKSAVDKYGTSFMNAINSGSGSKIRPTRGVQYRQNDGMVNSAGGFGDMAVATEIASALTVFSEAFTLMSKLSNLLSTTISNMTSIEIKHTINIDGTLNIPGFSQINIDSIVRIIGDDISDQMQRKIERAFNRFNRRQDRNAE